jgi:thioredoxin-like negative regulator of GroEL
MTTSLTLDERLRPAGASAEAFEAFTNAVWTQPRIPAPLLELCRLLIARMHSADAERAAGKVPVDADKKSAVLAGDWSSATLFSAGDRAVLDLAELYAIEPASITDEAAAAVVAHYGDGGLVTLIEALGVIDGRIRLALLFHAMETN